MTRRKFLSSGASLAAVLPIGLPAVPALASGGYVPPRYHSGYIGEAPAILQRGETVLPLVYGKMKVHGPYIQRELREAFDQVAAENSRQAEVWISSRR